MRERRKKGSWRFRVGEKWGGVPLQRPPRLYDTSFRIRVTGRDATFFDASCLSARQHISNQTLQTKRFLSR